MPNIIDASGLQVKTVTEVSDDLKAGLRDIYGQDINLDQNSPDGQLVGIFAQAAADLLELLVDVYNSFSVESAYGVTLDQRVALNGLTRRAGTYTTTPVLVTVNQALTLIGLDELESDPTAQVFTVKDDAGNQWYLAANHAFGGAGSATLTFRAVEIGRVEVLPNTITNQVTTVLGVTAVNNPTVTGTVLGVNEETDAELKIRHGRSFKLAATSPVDSIEAALANLPDVIDAIVLSNDSDVTANGIPAHSIWAIVRGGTPAEIAGAIYAKKNAGCGMKGTETYDVVRPNNTIFTAKWDEAIAQNLHIKFGILPRVPGATFNEDNIKVLLAQALKYRLNQVATIGDVVQAMATIAPDAIVITVGVSDDGVTFGDTASPTDAQRYFTVEEANIDIL